MATIYNSSRDYTLQRKYPLPEDQERRARYGEATASRREFKEGTR